MQAKRKLSHLLRAAADGSELNADPNDKACSAYKPAWSQEMAYTTNLFSRRLKEAGFDQQISSS